MRRAVKIITIEITTSVAESIPSPTTARLPAHKPMMILDAEGNATKILSLVIFYAGMRRIRIQ